MHILIAEDDVPVAKFLSSGLESEHYNVRIATAGRQVSQMMEASQCDLVILDLNLPDVSGMEVLRQVRSARPHLPVLILTGSARVEDRARAAAPAPVHGRVPGRGRAPVRARAPTECGRGRSCPG